MPKKKASKAGEEQSLPSLALVFGYIAVKELGPPCRRWFRQRRVPCVLSSSTSTRFRAEGTIS